MAKTGWNDNQKGMGNTPLKEFHDPISGKPLNSIGEPRPEQRPRPVGGGKRTNDDGLA